MDQELLNEFIVEAKANIDQMEEILLKANCFSSNNGNIDALFRAAHSIKGTAGFFGLSKITTLAHVMESVLDELREKNLEINGIKMYPQYVWIKRTALLGLLSKSNFVKIAILLKCVFSDID